MIEDVPFWAGFAIGVGVGIVATCFYGFWRWAGDMDKHFERSSKP